MPPARSRIPAHDNDNHSEAGSAGTREKPPTAAEKRRQNAAASAADKGAVNANGSHAHEGIEGMGWDDLDVKTLHRYRHAYRLNIPSATKSFNNIVLSTGLGKKSPSRVRARIARDTLATAVRKNFNAQPIQENEVIVNFLYSVKNQDKHFRLRFPPPLGKKFDT